MNNQHSAILFTLGQYAVYFPFQLLNIEGLGDIGGISPREEILGIGS